MNIAELLPTVDKVLKDGIDVNVKPSLFEIIIGSIAFGACVYVALVAYGFTMKAAQ